jgi:hypothetical protein
MQENSRPGLFADYFACHAESAIPSLSRRKIILTSKNCESFCDTGLVNKWRIAEPRQFASHRRAN